MEKHVYLLIGQRGSGKSHYVERLVANQPELSVASRDEILIRKFGSTDTSPYTGEQWYAMEVLHRFLRFVLGTRPKVKLLLDCWTEESRDRILLIQKLREYGATRVTALYFRTSREVVSTWFWLKPGIAKMGEMSSRPGEGLMFFREDAPSRDYAIFHRRARHINSDGFDEVIRVDPQKEVVFLA
jgi:hypothetical protein